MGRETRGNIGASKRIGALIRALLLSILDLLTEPYPASLFCSSVGLAWGLI